MTAIHLLTAAVPLLQQLFPPVPLIKQVQDIPVLIGAVLLFCLAVAYLALWRAAPDYRVFRSLGIYTFAASVVQFLAYFEALVLSLSVRAVATGLLVEAAGEAMRVSNRRWTRFLWPVYVFAAFAVWFPSTVFLGDWSIGIAAVPLGILIVQGFRRGNSRDRMVAAAFSVYFFVRLTLLTSFERLTGIGSLVIIGNWHWSINSLTQSLLGATALTIFVRDLIRDRREKERLAAELAAGRAVQQVLIPEETPVIPGFNIQSVYKPFGEVGGDFFQIIPLPGGSTLIVLGDVSGKGLKAAMAVSLIVGAIRTFAEVTNSPAEILAGLNRRLHGRLQGGFATAIALRLDADGSCVLASAGHTSPFINDRELSLPGAFPLGLTAFATYEEQKLMLARSEHLALYTDGLLEARNATGELYSFERLKSLFASKPTAEQATQAAVDFGQDDDITVLTLRRAALSST